MKRCPGCGGRGPFGRNRTRVDGLSYLCKKCRAEDQQRFKEGNLERVTMKAHANYLKRKAGSQ